MMPKLVIFLCFAIIVYILLAMESHIVISYIRKGGKQDIQAELVALWGAYRHRLTGSGKGVAPPKGILQTLMAFSHRFTIERLELKVCEGTGDAYYTAMLAGVLWAAVGMLVAYISGIFKSKSISINVLPDFNKRNFRADLGCILSIKNVHIIRILIKILLNRR